MAVLSFLTGRTLPSIKTGNQVARINQRQELVTKSVDLSQLSKEGTLSVAQNATPGTQVALPAAIAAFAPTGPVFFFRNPNAADGTTSDIEIVRIKINMTTIPTAATSLQLAVVVDSQATTRVTSGGAAMTFNNTTATNNSALNQAGSGLIGTTAIVLSAAGGTAKNVGRAILRTQIPVLNDVYEINFGTCGNTAQNLISSTTAVHIPFSLPPLIIPPQQQAMVYLWAPGSSGAMQFEYEIMVNER